MLARLLGQGEDAPVLDAADGATGAQDDGTCCFGESVEGWVLELVMRWEEDWEGEGVALFDLGQFSWPDLGDVSFETVVVKGDLRLLSARTAF